MAQQTGSELTASRRRFLQGAATASGLAMAGTTSWAAGTKPSSGHGATLTDYDVIIVGGGFSGVTAARECSRAGLSTLLLEARSRIGGRTFTTQFGPYHIELGGTWVHWTQPFVWSEVQRYGLTIEETPGASADRYVALVDGQRRNFTAEQGLGDIVAGVEAYFSEARAAWDRPYDATFTWQELVARDPVSAANRMAATKLTPLQRDVVAAFVESMAHCPLRQASYVEMMRWYAAPGFNFGALLDSVARYKLKEGTEGLIHRIAKDGRADMELSTPVTRVEQASDYVRVHPERGKPRTARAVILALPPRVLKDIAFEPALSAGKMRASREGFTHSGIKYYAEVKGRLGRVQLLARAPHLAGIAFTYAQGTDRTLLVGFSSSPTGLAGNDAASVQSALRELIPDIAVTDCISYGWNEDPYSQGTFSGFAPGQFANGYNSLAQHEGRVLMAGGDVGNAAWRNFIDGAIGRGLRVAHDAVQLLQA